MSIRKIFFTLIVLILLFSSTANATNRYISLTLKYDNTTHPYNEEEIFVAIDGKELSNLSMPPIILNNYSLVPAREVFEKLGAKVEWKKNTEQVYITLNNTVIVIPINSVKTYVNGEAKYMDTSAKIINNKTMIPLRFVTTALGFEIKWNSKTRTANIITVKINETTTKEVTTEITTMESIPQVTIKPDNNKYQNIIYDYNNDSLCLKNINNIKVNSIKEYDNYINSNYTIEIDGNFTNTFNNAEFVSNSNYIKSCKVTVENNKTTIVFYENKIIAMEITENNGSLCFKPISPKEKYNKIIVLDAGHGGEMPGAIGNNLIEKDLTLKIALSAMEKFERDGSVKCYMTRTADTNPSFDERTRLANEVGDAFISIHINSATSADPHGTETFCLYANDLGNGLTSYRVAEEMLMQLLNKLNTQNRKVKTDNLKVLRDSKVPSSLIEIGFISNANDAELMKNNIDKVGEAIYDGVINLFNKYAPIR